MKSGPYGSLYSVFGVPATSSPHTAPSNRGAGIPYAYTTPRQSPIGGTARASDRNHFIPKWDFAAFRERVISMSTYGSYLEARTRPDTIKIGFLSQITRRLSDLTRGSGLEHARTFLVSTLESKLIASNEITRGTETSVKLSWSFPSTFLNAYKRSGFVHTHPGSETAGLHFSGRDFKTFIGDEEQVFMMVAWQQTTMLVLKTTATPRLNQEAMERTIDKLEREYLFGRRSLVELMAFTKQVCVEFGLVLYMAYSSNPDVANRIEVTR